MNPSRPIRLLGAAAIVGLAFSGAAHQARAQVSPPLCEDVRPGSPSVACIPMARAPAPQWCHDNDGVYQAAEDGRCIRTVGPTPLVTNPVTATPDAPVGGPMAVPGNPGMTTPPMMAPSVPPGSCPAGLETVLRLNGEFGCAAQVLPRQ